MLNVSLPCRHSRHDRCAAELVLGVGAHAFVLDCGCGCHNVLDDIIRAGAMAQHPASHRLTPA